MERDAPVTRPARRQGAERARDIGIIAAGAVGVLLILALSGALGWVEALTACLVILAGALAYHVGSTRPERTDTDADGRHDTPTDERAWDPDALVRALPFPAMHVGPDGRVGAMNLPAKDVFHAVGGRQPLARSVIRQPRLLEAVERALARGLPDAIEIASPGEDAVWLAHVSRLGRTGGVLVSLEDRTAARRAEQARADFLANASHELRTPLTSLAGFIETMRGPARDDKESWDRFLEIMFEQTERMRRLIGDLLSLSRIEFNEHKIPDRITDLSALTQDALGSLRPVAAEREIEIDYHGPDDGLMAVAVADEMTQVVQNLVVNAIKYSDDATRITVSCGMAATLDAALDACARAWPDTNRMTILRAPAHAQSRGVWIRVADEGPGIGREHLPRLGQRFYRVDQSRGGEVSGTGLGLAIVKHVMLRHRGGFAVESRLGSGSAFGIWFPAADPPSLPGNARQAPNRAEAGREDETAPG